MNEQATVNVTISDLDGSANRTIRLISVSELDVLSVPKEIQVHNIGGKKWRGSFVADAEFIGERFPLNHTCYSLDLTHLKSY